MELYIFKFLLFQDSYVLVPETCVTLEKSVISVLLGYAKEGHKYSKLQKENNAMKEKNILSMIYATPQW